MMPRTLIDEFVDEQRGWLDPVGKTLAQWVGAVREQGGSAGLQLMNFLHGVWLGHPLHATVTDGPVGAWTAAMLLDALDVALPNKATKSCADGAIGIGLLAATLAIPAGLADWHELSGHNRRLGLLHGLLNLGISLAYVTSLLLRRGKARPLGVTLGSLAYASAGVSAYIGGDLVYKLGIGVNRTAWHRSPREWTAVLPEAELPENELHRATANGANILMVKRNGQIYALDHTCTHMGGALSEGKLAEDGVVCPLHESIFALADGHVIAGPATIAERVYEVRVQNGQIEVRAPR
jgi:nitrite reductase/ring-hydroxylating ferredoxin subunit/uncharacterized membrane protein